MQLISIKIIVFPNFSPIKKKYLKFQEHKHFTIIAYKIYKGIQLKYSLFKFNYIFTIKYLKYNISSLM